MYPFSMYLDGNQIGVAPPWVFTYNTELTRLKHIYRIKFENLVSKI